MISTNKDKLLTAIFKYMWIIILLPKMLQFVVYSLIVLYVLLKDRVSLNKVSILFITGGFIQIAAIFFQLIFNNTDLTRTLAGFNTALIWVVAAIYYSMFTQYKNREELLKYVRINLLILFSIYLLYLAIKVQKIHILGYTLTLSSNDYLSSGKTTRFNGLMGTVIAPSHLLCMSIPFLLLDEDKKNDLLNIFCCLLGFIAVVATHSRMGLLIVGAMMFLMIRRYLINIAGYGMVSRLDFLLVVGVICGVIVFYKEIADKFIDFFYSRSGSNGARFMIYRESIKKVLDTNPVFGVGIKYMLETGGGYSYPLGSHCTYIGILYKTGIIGAFVYLSAFIETLKAVWKNIKTNRNGLTIMAMILCYFVFLIFADLDGSNWVIVSMFAFWGLLSYEKG